ncbi:hypothetical protein ABPG72_017598 [Tetrahymena utriculariae]
MIDQNNLRKYLSNWYPNMSINKTRYQSLPSSEILIIIQQGTQDLLKTIKKEKNCFNQVILLAEFCQIKQIKMKFVFLLEFNKPNKKILFDSNEKSFAKQREYIPFKIIDQQNINILLGIKQSIINQSSDFRFLFFYFFENPQSYLLQNQNENENKKTKQTNKQKSKYAPKK